MQSNLGHTLPRLMVTALLLLTPAQATAQAPARTQDSAEADLRRRYLPNPADVRSIRTLARSLAVDDPQDIDDAIDRYKATWSTLEDGPGRQVRSRWTICFDVDSASGTARVDWIPELLELLEARTELFDAADRADDALFNELAITDDGSGAEEIGRLRRARRRELLAQPEQLPGTSFDLPGALLAGGMTEETLTPIRPWIDEWEKAVDLATRKRWATLNDLEWREAVEMVELGPGWRELLDPREVAEIRHRRDMYAQARLATELPLREANTLAIQRLVQLLPPDISSELTRRFRAATQPDLLSDEAELARLATRVTRLLADAPDATDESTRKSRETIDGLMAITTRRLAERNAEGCRTAERLRALQLVDATAIANGGSIPRSEEAGAVIDDRIEILQTRIELLRIDRTRRGIIGEMARMLLAAIPAERMRSGTARQARALIDANTIHDQNVAWRIEQLEDAIRQLEISRNQDAASFSEPAILDVDN